MAQKTSSRLPSFAPNEAESDLKDKLRSLRFHDKEREVQATAKSTGLPYFNLEGFPINPDSLAVIEEDQARSLGLVCFWYSIGDLRLGSINPTAVEVQAVVKELSERLHVTPRLYLISLESLRIAFEAYRRVPRRSKLPSGVRIDAKDLEKYSSEIKSLGALTAKFKNVSTTEAVTVMVAGAMQTRSSDIHVEAREADVQLRYRIDGVLYPVTTLPKIMYAKMVSRLKLLAGLKINVTEQPQDGRFTIHAAKDRIDVRVSTLPTAHGESIVMRLLRWTATGIAFEQLGLTGRARQYIESEIKKPNGMILVTGPTGSGKSTTLYAVMNKLKGDETKIITLEDPIEYRLPGVNQSQVDTSRGYTFASGLRSIVRQDPNIIMVGEIRDLETAEIAANAAQTGHLVLSTLHTNDAAGAIPRLRGMGLAAFLIPASLNAVVGQRLVRKLCESCKTETAISAETKQRVEDALAELPKTIAQTIPKRLVFWKGGGCNVCQGLGYKGQIGIFEVLRMTKELEQSVLAESLSENKVRDLARKQGMVTMFQDGSLKALEGITSIDEVLRVTK